MKHKGYFQLVGIFCVVALVTACGLRGRAGVQYQVYFPAGVHLMGQALQAQTLTLQLDSQEPLETAQALMNQLLAGPEDENLATPFPAGLTMSAPLRWSQEHPGVIVVVFSEHYSDLTDISLTLADYCVTLTLCQLEEVAGVEITWAGPVNSNRDHDVLTPNEVVLPGGNNDLTRTVKSIKLLDKSERIAYFKKRGKLP